LPLLIRFEWPQKKHHTCASFEFQCSFKPPGQGYCLFFFFLAPGPEITGFLFGVRLSSDSVFLPSPLSTSFPFCWLGTAGYHKYFRGVCFLYLGCGGRFVQNPCLLRMLARLSDSELRPVYRSVLRLPPETLFLFCQDIFFFTFCIFRRRASRP